MSCMNCGDDRVLVLSAKCADMCCSTYKGEEKEGYVPYVSDVGGGDYIDVGICLTCGQVQGEFPKEDPDLSGD